MHSATNMSRVRSARVHPLLPEPGSAGAAVDGIAVVPGAFLAVVIAAVGNALLHLLPDVARDDKVKRASLVGYAARGPRLPDAAVSPVVVVAIHLQRAADVGEVTGAFRLPCRFLRAHEHGKQDRSQDRDDRNHDQQFDQGKSGSGSHFAYNPFVCGAIDMSALPL